MADEDDRAPAFGHLAHLAEAFALECRVTDRQHLVHDQDLRLEMGRDGEGQPDVHPTRVALDRRVQEPLDLGELDDLVELAPYLLAAHAEDDAVEEDVLPARQLRMEPGPDLEEAADAAPHLDAPLGRLRDPAEDLQEGRLPGAVSPDDPEPLSPSELEAEVAQRPELLARRLRRWGSSTGHARTETGDALTDDVAQGGVPVGALVADRVALSEPLDADGPSAR